MWSERCGRCMAAGVGRGTFGAGDASCLTLAATSSACKKLVVRELRGRRDASEQTAS